MPVPTRAIARARHVIYPKKATEFARSMDASAERGDWNAVGLAAVHAVISAADALATFYLSERHAGKNHADVVELLYRLPLSNARRKADQALLVIHEKNTVEYEDADFTAVQARHAKARAHRFLSWARASIEAAKGQ